MAFLGDIGSFFGLGDTKQVLSSGAKAAAQAYAGAPPTALSGAFERTNSGVAQTTSPAVGQESARSGEINPAMPMSPVTAGFGLAGPALQAFRQFAPSAGRFLSRPSTQIGLGLGGAALVGSGGDMQGQTIRVTRKQQKQVKDMVMLIGIEATAQMLGISTEDVVFIMVKKFRARSQGITGAQLRNARRVNNKVIHMYNSLKSGYGSTTRRAPARKSTTITQVK